MALIQTKDGDVDETLLQIRRVETMVEDGEYKARVTTTEYCYTTCSGGAHQSGTPDDDSFFCARHIKRDVAVNVLTLPAGLSEVFQQLQ